MPDSIQIRTIQIQINGAVVAVAEGMTVAVALMASGRASTRRSVTGSPRGPLCGMGICFECRVSVDGTPHVKACQTLCRPGMEVIVDE
jgi:predicted molibdopterin-dependent oxidoreductase YjgC